MNNKGIIIGVIIALIAVVIIVACVLNGKPAENVTNTAETSQNENIENVVENVSKNEETGTAGSNIPLKDNLSEAEYQIKVAMQKVFEETYGDEVVDARIYVTKVYTAEDELQNEALKEKKLGPNEVAFEVSYELKIADNVTDTDKFTAGNGVYDKESGWVKEKSSVGILRPDGDSYKVTDLGTGW